MKLCNSLGAVGLVNTYSATKRVLHSDASPAAIVALGAISLIKCVIIKCVEASVGTTINLGWVGDTSIIAADADIPKALGEVAVFTFPCDGQAVSRDVIATLSGACTAGEWDIWVQADIYG